MKETQARENRREDAGAEDSRPRDSRRAGISPGKYRRIWTK